MALTLSPSQLRSFLIEAIPARFPILIEGAPGIGKSDIVGDAVRACGANLILSHPAVADPTDAKGFPCIVDGVATFLPFGELRRAINATAPTVWFLDDLGQASPAVQASYMQLLLARCVDSHILSDHVTFIGATNRRTDRAGVTGVLEPVKSRFYSIVELIADLGDWCRWALDHDVPPMLIAYLRSRPDRLSAFSAKADLTNSPVPRTWAHFAGLMKLNLSADIRPAVLGGAVGEGDAGEYLAFEQIAASLPNVDQILVDPNAVPVPSKPSILYALAGALAYRATPQNFARVARYIERMIEATRGEFAVLTWRDAIHRTPAILQTPAAVRLMTGELGTLINGTR